LVLIHLTLINVQFVNMPNQIEIEL
jgi:hypothetical protein